MSDFKKEHEINGNTTYVGLSHFAGLSPFCFWLSDQSEDIKKRNTDDDDDDDDDPLETKVVFSYGTLPKENQEKEG